MDNTAIDKELKLTKKSPDDKIIALAGNPNVGKSTVFNSLTGLNQHTGNWPGKTVSNAAGNYIHNEKNFCLVDLPGTYSLMASSVEEEVARDYLCFGNPDAVVVVTDATCLERNLNLVLQTLEATRQVIVCVNLLDEAKKKKIEIDLGELELELGVPVVGTSARSEEGLDALMDEIYDLSVGKTNTHSISLQYDTAIEKAVMILQPAVEKVAQDKLDSRWLSIRLLENDPSLRASLIDYLGYDPAEREEIREILKTAKDILRESGLTEESLRDKLVSAIVLRAEKIYQRCVRVQTEGYNSRDRKIDRVLTSKKTGIPIMICLLGLIFWLTITGANYPSEMISTFLFWIEDKLNLFFEWMHSPAWLQSLLVSGVYRTLAWVVSVMLPPMAIFFPLFTLLEDFGYLPRIAFNMDKFFKKACTHGKQSLTMW